MHPTTYIRAIVGHFCNLLELQLNTLSRLDASDPTYRDLLHSSRQMPLGLLKILEVIEQQLSVGVEDAGTNELHFLIQQSESMLTNIQSSLNGKFIEKTEFDRQYATIRAYTEVFTRLLTIQEKHMQDILDIQFKTMRRGVIDTIKQIEILRQPVTI